MQYEAYFLNKQTGKETPILYTTNLRDILKEMMRTIWEHNVPGYEFNIILMPWKLKASIVRTGTSFSLAERNEYMMCIQYRTKR
jgi:hypothetical protein